MKKSSSVRIICKTDRPNTMHFLAEIQNETYALFSTNYFNQTAFDFYGGTLRLSTIMQNNFGKVHHHKKHRLVCCQNLRDHIIRNLKALEKELDCPIFDQSAKYTSYAAVA